MVVIVLYKFATRDISVTYGHLEVCYAVAVKLQLFYYRATACNAMHALAVAILSVCQTHVLWQNERLIYQFINKHWHMSFLWYQNC